jgi:hypothetical protein
VAGKLGCVLAVAVVGSLAGAGTAMAAAPTLLSVEHQHRHPTATFAMPGADFAAIYLATSPDRATDGSFLDENVELTDVLTADEIKSGRWVDSAQLDPGRYYAMLWASDDDCSGDPACMQGYSTVLTLAVTKPAPHYRGGVHAYRYLSTVDLRFRVAPLGERVRYRVCWTLTSKRRKCARSSVKGYSWSSPATDQIEVRKRGMPGRTSFAWYVHGRKVASKRVRIPRA